MYKALNLVKSCAPCVLLIDEVEKALGGYKSSNASDSGAIARAFGSVLELNFKICRRNREKYV